MDHPTELRARALHPERDDHGRPVYIERPDTPTDNESWFLPDRIATAVPGSPLPHELLGIALREAALPEPLLAGASATHFVALAEEPPFEPAPDMRSAAGVVIHERDGRIWVVHPTNGFAGYRATFPKGTIDGDRSLQATAIVECFEESGLLVRLTGVVGDFDRSASRTRYYTAVRIGGSPAAMGWESQAVSLVPPTRLPALADSIHDRPVLEALGLLEPAPPAA